MLERAETAARDASVSQSGVSHLSAGRNAGSPFEAFTSRQTHPRVVWGERAVGGFFEDIHVLVVVVIGMATLLASFAAAFVTYQRARDRDALLQEASRILRVLLTNPALLHGGEDRVLDLTSLAVLDGAGLTSLAGTPHPVQLVLSERSGTDPRTFIVETAPVGPEHAVAATAASVWHSDVDVRAARVTVALGG